MATEAKSRAVAKYRREIADYLRAVKLATGWSTTEMGARAGKLAHTTIGRAMKEHHTLAFPALLALEAAAGLAIPETLRAAAVAAQHPPTASSRKDDALKRLREEFAKQSPEAQRAFLDELAAVFRTRA